MALDLARMRVFATVVSRGGYSAAARELGLAQATVSHHVKQLEREFDASLLRYENREIHLTPAGEEVLRAARVLLREEEEVRRAVRDVQQGHRGRVRLGATLALEQQAFFREVVAPFCRDHDGVLLSLRFGHSRAEARAVMEDELDLAYVIDWHLPSDVPFEPLHDAVLRFLVPAQHPLTTRGTVTVEDIAEAGLISAPLTSVEALYYHQLLSERGFTSQRPVLELDGIQARILATRAGLGVVATFCLDKPGGESPGGLVALDVEGPDTRVAMGLVAGTEGSRTPGGQQLAAWLRSSAPVERSRRRDADHK